jgi:hypothetical protein
VWSERLERHSFARAETQAIKYDPCTATSQTGADPVLTIQGLAAELGAFLVA